MNVHLVLFLVSLFYGILFSWAGEIMPKYLNAEALVWMRVAFATLAFQLIGIWGKSIKIDWKKHGLELAICGFFWNQCQYVSVLQRAPIYLPHKRRCTHARYPIVRGPF